MRFDRELNMILISARELAERAAQGGSLGGASDSPTSEEGRALHKLLSESQGAGFRAEYPLSADFESGSLKDRAKALIPILIPLLISSVRRAYELAEAMECRCYNGGEGKTRMKQLRLAFRDYFMAVITVLFCVGIVLINLI